MKELQSALHPHKQFTGKLSDVGYSSQLTRSPSSYSRLSNQSLSSNCLSRLPLRPIAIISTGYVLKATLRSLARSNLYQLNALSTQRVALYYLMPALREITVLIRLSMPSNVLNWYTDSLRAQAAMRGV